MTTFTDENFPISTFSAIIATIIISSFALGYCSSKHEQTPQSIACIVVAAITMALTSSVYVWILHDQYIPNGIERNDEIDASITACLVTQIVNDITVHTPKLRFIVSYMHLPDNVTNSYDVYCAVSEPSALPETCYPTNGTYIPCYPYENNYSIDPHYTNVSRLRDHLAWGYVQLLFSGIPLISVIITAVYAFYNYCKDRHICEKVSSCWASCWSSCCSEPCPHILIQCCPRTITTTTHTVSNYRQQVALPSIEDPVRCAVCMLRKPCFMFEECKHVCLCEICNTNYSADRCVICRCVTPRTRVYL